jgi:hypothetical protein
MMLQAKGPLLGKKEAGLVRGRAGKGVGLKFQPISNDGVADLP